jgi:glycosyltransferase involved in cell wall biosynthesis
MGLTAMEAMACGAAVILPQDGGASSFAVHEKNALIVNTQSKQDCLNALERLYRDNDLRIRLQRQAIADVCQYPPELAAFNILQTLFEPKE